MNKLVKPITNVALVAMLLLSFAVLLPRAYAAPVVYIDPASNIFYSPPVGIGDTFTVEVWIANVTDMFAYEFKIGFQNDTIGGVSAVRPVGHFLTPVTPGSEFIPVWQLKDLDATHQYYHLGYTRLAPETGESGTGVLIEITFEVLVEPPWGGSVSSPIYFIESKVSDTVPSPVVHTAVDSYYELNWAPPTTNPYLDVDPALTILGAGAPLVGTPGAFFTVDVDINNVDADWRLIGAEFKIAYNDTLIDFISAAVAPWVDAFGDIYMVPPVEGYRGDGLAYMHTAVILLPHILGPPAEWTTYISGSGALVTLTFEVVMQEEFPWLAESPLDLYETKFSDENADPITGAADTDGLVRILGFIVGRNIDVYTQYPNPYGGQGPNNPADTYAPQDEVCLYANVTYNLDPVQNKLVDFEVKWPDGTPLLTRTAITDIYGVAYICFRIPWPDQISPEDVFGIWNVTATVDIANEVVNDTLTFKVDWLMEVISIETAEEFQKQKPAPLGEMWFKVCWEVRTAQTRHAIITVVVYDDLGVPIAWTYTEGDYEAPAICTPATYCYNFTLYIPTWAYVGPATVYANIYTDFPQNGGVSYAPEAYAEFRIIKP